MYWVEVFHGGTKHRDTLRHISYAAKATNEQTDRQTNRQTDGHRRRIKPPAAGSSMHIDMATRNSLTRRFKPRGLLGFSFYAVRQALTDFIYGIHVMY